GDEERLEFRRLGVRISYRWRQCVGNEAVLRQSLEAPVDRNPDGVHFLAVDVQCPDALGHDGPRLDEPADRSRPHPVPALAPVLLTQLLTDLRELFRLHNGAEPRVLGPVVEMLGEPVGGRHVWELLSVAELVEVILEHPGRRITFGLWVLGVQGIHSERRLEWFIMLRKWPFRHLVHGEEACYT